MNEPSRLTTTVILSSMLLGPLVPAAGAAWTPQPTSEPPPVGGDGAWRVTDERRIEVDGQPFALSPDGAWLAGTADDGRACDVETLTPTCAEVDTRVVVGLGATAMTWAPDSSAFAFVEGTLARLDLGDAYVFAVATGELTNLTHTGGAAAGGPMYLGAGWTSDSQQVVLGVNHGLGETRPDAVVLVDRSGGEPVAMPLPDWDAEDYEILFPPLVTADAVFVAIDSDADFGGVWRLSSGGADPEQMVASNSEPPIEFPVPVSASRDGRYVNVLSFSAFQRLLEGDTYFLLDVESGTLTTLVSGSTPQLIAFAPSGDVGLLERELDGEGRLHTLNPSTGEVTPVADSTEARSWWRAIPTWAENDTVLLPDDEGGTLVTLESPGGSPRSGVHQWRIAEMREIDVDGQGLALSPDGQWLAGVGPDDTPCFWDVETLTPACASEVLPILADVSSYPLFPVMAWAPDSSAVVFSLDAIRSWIDSDIYLFERERGTVTNLTDDGFEGSGTDAPAGVPVDVVPSWSPDGRQIVFSRFPLSSEEPPTTVIMRIARSGGEPVEVTTVTTDLRGAVWKPMFWLPDDTVLYTFGPGDPDDPDNGVWRVGIDGGEPAQVVAGERGAEVPEPIVTDVDAAGGRFSMFSLRLRDLRLTSVSDSSTPAFWIGRVGDGSLLPVPDVDSADGEAITTAPAKADEADEADEALLYPHAPAALSPDGTSALVVYRTPEFTFSLATMDTATGELSFLRIPPAADLLPLELPPQWADNNTALLLGPDHHVDWLVTLEPV